MAKKTIAFDVTISAADAVRELDNLDKKADSTSESMAKVGTSTAKSVSVAEQSIKKLNDEFKRLNPEQKAESIKKVSEGVLGSFQAIQGSFALFGKNAEAIEIAFQKAQSAFLVADGIKKVTEGVGQLGTAFSSLKSIILSNPIVTILVGAIAAVAAGMKLLRAETDKQVAAIDRQIEANRAASDAQVLAKEHEIRLLRASGKETAEVEKQKLSILINRLKQEIELVRKRFELERKQAIDSLEQQLIFTKFTNNLLYNQQKEVIDRLKKLKGAKTEEELELEKQLADAEISLMEVKLTEEKKHNDKAVENYKKAQENKLKISKETDKQFLENAAHVTNKSLDTLAKIPESLPQLLVSPVQAATEEMLTAFEIMNAKIKQSVDDIASFLSGRFGTASDFTTQTIQQNLATAANFFDAAQQNQLNAVEGNEAAQEKIRKKFFDKQKKVQIAQGLLSTYEAAIQAFKSTAANPITSIFPPAPYIAAGSAIAFGLSNVAKIRAQEFTGGGASGSNSISAPNIGLNSSNPFQVGTQALNPQDIEAGNNVIPKEPVKVVVAATDISDALKSNQQINNNAEVT